MTEERARIRNVYRRRAGAGGGRYASSNAGHRYMIDRREEATLQLLQRAGMQSLTQARILELGCGRGEGLAQWMQHGAPAQNIHGIDLIPDFVHQAAAAAPGCRLAVGSADQLPYAAGRFDIVGQRTVFTSILDQGMRRAAAGEMRRVLAPGGLILWYDFRYPSPGNPDVRAVGRREIGELFPGCIIEAHSITLLPPLARMLAPVSTTACRILEAVFSPLRSHYLAIIREAQA